MFKNIQLRLIVFLLGAFFIFTTLQAKKKHVQTDKPFADIEGLMQTMSLEEKIAQLIVVRSFCENSLEYYEGIAEQIGKHQFGGVCFFKGNSESYPLAYNLYQSKAKLPLWVSIDGEWGPSMRITDAYSLPRQQTLGAIENDSLVYQTGKEIGKLCKILGIHANYSPLADINNNPLNPVINSRSFGEDRVKVANKSSAMYRGLKSESIFGSVKHFPGHGNTQTDSHEALPILTSSYSALDSIELFPFKRLIADSVDMVMVGHLAVPAMDSTKLPASLSYTMVTEILKKRMGYSGLVITDGLEMSGVTVFASYPGEVELKALQAGVDILLLPLDPLAAIEAIKKAVSKKILSEDRIDQSCKKVLEMKQNLGLLYGIVGKESDTLSEEKAKLRRISSQNLKEKLNSPDLIAFNKTLFENALTLVFNKKYFPILPNTIEDSLVVLHLGYNSPTDFEKAMNFHSQAKHIRLHRDFDLQEAQSVMKELEAYKHIIISFTNVNHSASRKYGITDQSIAIVDSLLALEKSISLILFASPYALDFFSNIERAAAILVCYQEQKNAQIAAADLIFGGIPARGSLPVSVNEKFKAGSQCFSRASCLSYALPREVNMSNTVLSSIDSIIEAGLKEKAYPACQVFVAKDGRVILNKAYGKFTYDSLSRETCIRSVFDLASLSKVCATTLAIMKLYEEGLINLDEPISDVLKRLKRTNKKNISPRQLLTHQSGLASGISWKDDTLYHGHSLFSKTYDKEDYSVQISDSLYLYKKAYKKYKDLMDKSPLDPNPKYVYSDIGFNYLKEYIEEVCEMPLEDYVHKNFYEPLGLKIMGYKPLERLSDSLIVPTEKDTLWRRCLLKGYVHDPTVALMGGVGGSAGLFANATEVGIIGQMLLNYGSYGEKRYFDSATIALFTSSDFSKSENRRGGGFDKPALKPNQSSPAAVSAPLESYGHSGFTGTYMWVDPKNKLVYVFLSNRICPSSANRKLIEKNIRTEIQERLYQNLEGGGK